MWGTLFGSLSSVKFYCLGVILGFPIFVNPYLYDMIIYSVIRSIFKNDNGNIFSCAFYVLFKYMILWIGSAILFCRRPREQTLSPGSFLKPEPASVHTSLGFRV